ncbi:MAG TPA: KUP/HAK/KT family potassium transporter, partial [Rubricoccaceae bacterium]
MSAPPVADRPDPTAAPDRPDPLPSGSDGHSVHPLPDDYAGALGHAHPGGGRYRLALALGALGVVYGDIGTSPLYSLKEVFGEHYGLAVTAPNVLGVLSLVVWSLILVISVKYLTFVMRADNAGEGGILALMALAVQDLAGRAGVRGRAALVAMGLFGAALLYGDGIITPAISVLSAIEGLNVVTPVFGPFVLPITVAILVGLFAVQSRGTAGIGRVFGPITLVWFLTLGVIGTVQMVQNPGVLASVNPVYGVEFFLQNGALGFLVLGSVFLVVTGGEALYADMGHFGVGPIRLAWFAVVLPCLLLNYMGQGALLIRDPAARENPVFHMVPEWAVIPLVILAAAATTIASQAVITGAFSLTMQAVQLGYLPRLRILHTSETEYGQVYVPAVNWALAAACIALVVAFQTSTALAAAYGIAVTSTMAITTALLYVVMRRRWGWPAWTAVPLTVVFLVIDLAFFGANIVKVLDGGWVPLALAAVVFVVMATWRRGREILGVRLAEGSLPLELALPDIARRVPRVPGTGVYLHSNPATTP